MRKARYFHKNEGFTLIETVLALAIVGVMLLSVFGVMGVAISANQGAVARTGAANILSAIISDIRSVPASSSATKSPIYGIVFPTVGTSSTPQLPFYVNDDDQLLSSSAGATYMVSYWTTGSTSPGVTPACQESSIRVVVSWPASATTANAQGTVETVVFVDRVQ